MRKRFSASTATGTLSDSLAGIQSGRSVYGCVCEGSGNQDQRVQQEVCDFAFHDLNLVRIETYVHVDNAASNRSMEKAGFWPEGCLQKKWIIGNRFCDVNLWALTAEREVY